MRTLAVPVPRGRARLRKTAAQVAMLSAAAVAAACGSSTSRTSTPAASGTSAKSATTAASTGQFSGAPITIATSAPINTPVTSLPQVFAGVQAAARAINARGGIHGHQVVVLTCNGQGSPSAEVACARGAVQAGAIAEVGETVFTNPGGFESTLLAGHVADVAPNAFAPPQFTSRNSFPIEFLNGEFAACTTPALAKIAGSSKVGVVTSQAPENTAFVPLIAAFARNQGVGFVGSVGVGQTTTDFAPIVQEMASKNPGVVVLNTFPNAIPPFLTTSVSTGRTWIPCTSDSDVAPGELGRLGAAAAKFYQGAALPPLTATAQYPELNTFISDMRAEQAAGDSAAGLSSTSYLPEALNSWLGMQIVEEVASKIKGPITGATFLAAISKATVNPGIVPPLDFSKPLGGGIFRRVFNPEVMLQRWDAAKKDTFIVPGVTVNALKASGL